MNNDAVLSASLTPEQWDFIRRLLGTHVAYDIAKPIIDSLASQLNGRTPSPRDPTPPAPTLVKEPLGS